MIPQTEHIGHAHGQTAQDTIQRGGGADFTVN